MTLQPVGKTSAPRLPLLTGLYVVASSHVVVKHRAHHRYLPACLVDASPFFVGIAVFKQAAINVDVREVSLWTNREQSMSGVAARGEF